MKNITHKIISVGKEKIDQQEGQSYFNTYTKDIVKKLKFISMKLVMLNYILKLMEQSKDKYFAQSALINGAFTEQEKQEFDNQIMDSIKICKVKISELQDMLKSQQSFLAAKNKTEYAHKEVAIGCLTAILNKVTMNFKDFKTYRSRQRERALNLTRSKKHTKSEIIQRPQEEAPQDGPLAMENKMLLMRYNDELEDIMKTQTQLKEISQVIQKMSETLYRQDLTTDQILSDASDSLHQIEQANKHLIDATKLNEKMGFCWSMLFFGLAVILLFYDFINQ